MATKHSKQEAAVQTDISVAAGAPPTPTFNYSAAWLSHANDQPVANVNKYITVIRREEAGSNFLALENRRVYHRNTADYRILNSICAITLSTELCVLMVSDLDS
jgi:hypothetical protein